MCPRKHQGDGQERRVPGTTAFSVAFVPIDAVQIDLLK